MNRRVFPALITGKEKNRMPIYPPIWVQSHSAETTAAFMDQMARVRLRNITWGEAVGLRPIPPGAGQCSGSIRPAVVTRGLGGRMTLRDYVDVLRNWWKAIAALTLVGVLAG